MPDFVHLQIKNPKDDETPIEAATQIFSSILPYPYIPLWRRTYIHPSVYAFEIFLINQTVSFYVTADKSKETIVGSVIASSFPKSNITKTTDPMVEVLKSKAVAYGQMSLNSYFYLPVKTYADFEDVDPLSALVGFLSKQSEDIKMAVQILVTPATFGWQSHAVEMAGHQVYDAVADKYSMSPQKLLIMQKAGFQGGKAVVRLIVGAENKALAVHALNSLSGTFGSFSLGEGNQFVLKKPRVRKKLLLSRIKDRKTGLFEKRHQVLNAQELATLWHPPGILLGGIKNIAWGKTLLGEAPANLPIATGASEEEKKETNYFATTEFKNVETVFGVKDQDRRKHVYIIGKTGAGKSTLIANMAIDDIRKDRGIGIIDPHGDLSETILDFIPKRRASDVVYLEPFDQERSFKLNVLEVHNPEQKHLVASSIVSIFSKIYGNSWGPRLEYILRNSVLTLLEIPGTTLVDILPLLSDQSFRHKIIANVQDPVLKNFWLAEFEQMSDKLRTEAVSPIQNKVGQFVSSKLIRNIIGSKESSISLSQIMDEGKILILNLSQGKLGEDNAALLGAMMITQIQLAAMGRSYVKEEDRQDFFLYVDEFQNFATSSFIKILSEARKYRLSLTLANQYIGQLDEEVQHSIFGNVGTLISFVVGAQDAYYLTREFSEIYSESELVSLGKFEAVIKLSVDGMTSSPFPARTLPLPSLKNENKEKIIQLSKERYARKAS